LFAYSRFHIFRKIMEINFDILRSVDYPKICWVDNPEIIGYLVAESAPFSGHLCAHEVQDGDGEIFDCLVSSVVGYVPMHQSPEPFDWVEVRAVGRDEVQFDAASWPCEPFLHQSGVMVAGIIEKQMNEPLAGMHVLNGNQQPDGALRIDSQGFQHCDPPGLQIDGAVNVQIVSARSLLKSDFGVARPPASNGASFVGWMHSVAAIQAPISRELLGNILVIQAFNSACYSSFSRHSLPS
jgi:hypothetical protein